MLVRIEKAQGCGYIAKPVSSRKYEQFRKNMILNGAGALACHHWGSPAEVVPEIYMQEFYAVEEAFKDQIPAKQLKNLDEGCPIEVRIDDWTFRHMLGYCSD